MTLSNRAEKYIKDLQRIDKWIANENLVLEYFDKQGLLKYDLLFDFQIKYAGLKLTIEGEQGQSFYLQLFSKSEMLKNEPIDYLTHNNEIWFSPGYHETAQYTFYINTKTEICTWEEEEPNIIYSSAEKLIEQYALKNKLTDKYENPYYYNIPDPHKLKIFLQQQGFTRIKECSDNYSSWMTNGEITIVRGTWLDTPASYAHIYATNEKKAEEILNKMQKEKLLT